MSQWKGVASLARLSAGLALGTMGRLMTVITFQEMPIQDACLECISFEDGPFCWWSPQQKSSRATCLGEKLADDQMIPG